MANHYPYSSQSPSHISPPPTTFLGKLQHHATTSPQLFSFFTLLITTSIFIFLSGLTLVATTLSLIIFFPLIILFSPIWLPLFIFIFLFLSLFGFGVVIVAALSWAYRYYFLKPVQSFGSVRIHDSPRRAKPYARKMNTNTVRIWRQEHDRLRSSSAEPNRSYSNPNSDRKLEPESLGSSS